MSGGIGREAGEVGGDPRLETDPSFGRTVLSKHPADHADEDVGQLGVVEHRVVGGGGIPVLFQVREFCLGSELGFNI